MRQGPSDRHHVRQARGDVVEAAGEDGDLIAVAVHLHPDPVELRVDDGGHSAALERRLRAGGGGGEHRLDRGPDAQADGLEGRQAALHQERGGRRGRGGQHGRPADGRDRHVERLGQALLHLRLQSTLTQLAGDEAGQQPLLRRGGPGEQRLHGRRPSGRGARPREVGHRGEGGVHLRDRQGRGWCGGWHVLQAPPAHAGASLPEAAAEVGDDDLDVLEGGVPQHGGDQVALGQPGPGGRQRRGGLRETAQQHEGIMPSATDKTCGPVPGARVRRPSSRSLGGPCGRAYPPPVDVARAGGDGTPTGRRTAAIRATASSISAKAER